MNVQNRLNAAIKKNYKYNCTSKNNTYEKQMLENITNYQVTNMYLFHLCAAKCVCLYNDISVFVSKNG